MDKGFYRKRNIDAMIENSDKKCFIIAIPSTSAFANKAVKDERNDIDTRCLLDLLL
ncbi:hypothetical protein LQZ18_09755 [Lachnospiraceae bacterium ZAX-1]